MAWTLEPEFRGWQDGAPTQPEAPPQFRSLTAQLPPGGDPVLFRQTQGEWRVDQAWHRDINARGAGAAAAL
jgi:hypothetical protein